MTDYLLAAIFDELAVANWQRSDPKARVPRPTPLPRPGDEKPRPAKTKTLDEARDWAARRREA